jgi:hypothetical protein
MHRGELHVPPAVQPVHDVGRGNDGEVNDLASLSFGSGTEYLAETYVFIDSKLKQNYSLATESLLQSGITIIRPNGSVEATKTAEEGSQIQLEPGPSGGRGGHTEAEAQTGATSQGEAASPKQKGRFDQELPDMHTGELHVPPAVQPVHDVGRGNDGEVTDLASLSFGSGTEYLSETYVLIDSEGTVLSGLY